MDSSNNEFKLNEERIKDIYKDFFIVIVVYVITLISPIFYKQITLSENIKFSYIMFMSTLSMGLIIKNIYKYILIAKNGYNKVNYKKFRNKYIVFIIILTSLLEIFKYFIFTKYSIYSSYSISNLLISISSAIIFTVGMLKSTKRKFTD